MLFRKKKKHVATSSRQWRELMYNAMRNDTKLNILISDSLVSINKLITTVDSEDARVRIKEYILSSNERKLSELVNRIPFDFDEVDYPLISLFVLKNNLDQYNIVIAESVNFTHFTYVDIVKGNFISENKFEPLMRVFPI